MGIAWKDPIVKLSSGVTGWQVMDVSEHVPAGAVGIMLHHENRSAGFGSYQVRHGDSADNDPDQPPISHNFSYIGLNAAKEFDAYLGSTIQDLWLVGYFEAGDAFFHENRVALTNGMTLGAWQPRDLDTLNAIDGSDTAIAALLELGKSGSSVAMEFGARHADSADNRINDFHASNAGFICSVKSSTNEIDLYLEDRAFPGTIYCTGYVKDTANAVFNQDPTDYSIGSAGTDEDLAALPSGGTGAFIEIFDGTNSYQKWMLHKKGGGSDPGADLYQDHLHSHGCAAVEADSNRLITGKVENTSVDFFLVGHTTAPPPGGGGTILPQMMQHH